MKSSISQNSESETPELASGDTDISPLVELNRHSDIRNVKTDVAHHDPVHDGHHAKGQEIVSSAWNPHSLEADIAHRNSTHNTNPTKNQEILSPAPDPRGTPQFVSTSQNIDRSGALVPPASDLPRELPKTTNHHEDLIPLFNLPVSVRRLFIGLGEEMEREDRDECSTAVRVMQEMSFKAFRTAKWLPTTSDTIKLEIHRIKRTLREWTKAAIKDDPRLGYLSTVFQGDKQVMDAFGEELSKVMVIRNNIPLEGLPERKASKVLLEALLAHHLFSNVFSPPFFFLGDWSSGLNMLYEIGHSWSPKDAHRWRSDTMRLGFPEVSKDEKVEAARLQMQTLIDQRAKIQAENFINSPANNLFDKTPELMIKLQNLYQEAGNLSYHLWTRRAVLKILTLNELNPSFDINDRMMTLHNMVKEDVENKLTGQPITLVVNPAIISYGTEDGEDYESPRIWTPAEVWLYNPLPKGPESNVGADAGVKS
ncbi:70c1f9a8-8226-42b3-a15d-2109d72ed539 [Sclerotinia trifoliorum]|uniref:70c1f9a8-8226-42b3-a15d-2109d72ed539 n=1 Tax=Sclerotinia trifoliorum TaxID=28548 RepID=A0A8H2VSQ8_9HELO|nr:70c1f9a8-8226-42b3-a15d-2109d72ed539 [Sclerotinia trifoliorum]